MSCVPEKEIMEDGREPAVEDAAEELPTPGV
jgi:hypothetical protein